MENVLEDLISTIERNSENNKAEITNVKLWASSWREEFRDKLFALIEETELDEYHIDVRLASVKNQLQQWLKEMEEIKDKKQVKLFWVQNANSKTCDKDDACGGAK